MFFLALEFLNLISGKINFSTSSSFVFTFAIDYIKHCVKTYKNEPHPFPRKIRRLQFAFRRDWNAKRILIKVERNVLEASFRQFHTCRSDIMKKSPIFDPHGLRIYCKTIENMTHLHFPNLLFSIMLLYYNDKLLKICENVLFKFAILDDPILLILSTHPILRSTCILVTPFRLICHLYV